MHFESIISIEAECVPQHIRIVIDESWSSQLIVAGLVQFNFRNTKP